MKLARPTGARTWVYLAALVVVLILIIVPLLQLRPYFEIMSSTGKLSLFGSYLVGRFNFSSADLDNLNLGAAQLNLSWRGQDFAATVGADSPAKAWLPVNFGLSIPDPQDLTIVSSDTRLSPGTPGPTSEGLEYLPTSTVAVIRSSRLQDQYQLDGKDVFRYTAARGTLGVTLTDKLGLVFVDQVTDPAGLAKTLLALKDIQVKPAVGYSGAEAAGAGFSEQKLGSATVYILNQPGLSFQPTFGQIGGYLIVASSPDLWQQAQAAYSSKSGFTTSPNYHQVQADWPGWSSGSVYLDLRALAGRGVKIQDDLAPLVKLNLSPQLLSYGIDTGRLHLLTAAWFSLSTATAPVPSRLVVRLTTR